MGSSDKLCHRDLWAIEGVFLKKLYTPSFKNNWFFTEIYELILLCRVSVYPFSQDFCTTTTNLI